MYLETILNDSILFTNRTQVVHMVIHNESELHLWVLSCRYEWIHEVYPMSVFHVKHTGLNVVNKFNRPSLRLSAWRDSEQSGESYSLTRVSPVLFLDYQSLKLEESEFKICLIHLIVGRWSYKLWYGWTSYFVWSVINVFLVILLIQLSDGLCLVIDSRFK